jgi:hypothetical protein
MLTIGCAQPVACPPIVIGEASYEICAFNRTFFNVSDQLGGYMYFTLGGQSLLHNCQSDNEDWDGFISAQFTETFQESSRCYDAAVVEPMVFWGPSYQALRKKIFMMAT